MRSILVKAGLCLCFISFVAVSSEDRNAFALAYFEAWKATQSPDATESDVDDYLAFLTDDVGYQHLPYVTSGLRTAGGKAEMKKGMMYYLGSTSSYEAQLENVLVGHNVIVIQYTTVATGVHPDNQQPVALDYRSVDVLELVQGKVAVIRHYSK